MARPASVAVIGAGIIGLSSAWFLQERGVTVTVYDRGGVGSGSSRANAGWLVPNMVSPLGEPSVLRGAPRSLLSPSAPLYIPLRLDGRRLRFLAGFARNCTTARWTRSMHAFAAVTGDAFDAFDALDLDGFIHPAAPLLACFPTNAARTTMTAEFEHVRAAGQSISFRPISGEEARSLEPSLSGAIKAAIMVEGQRFIDPGRFVDALAARVLGRGGVIVTDTRVDGLLDSGRTVAVSSGGERADFDAAVIATGALLNDLARPFGVRQLVAAGRGYSFTVPVTPAPARPIYFPHERLACTPIDGRLRVAGMMEFRPADAPLDPRRIAAVKAAAMPLFEGADFDQQADDWVGARPCTSDGLPLIGATTSPRVYAAAGHGMWGMTLGPWTGRAIAERVVSGITSATLAPFDPLR